MFAQTFSSDEADLSLLPGQDVFSGEPAPDAGEPGPFGEDGPFGEGSPWEVRDAGHEDYADHGDDPYSPDDAHDGWDPVFGGDV
ncbi:hypothetical protein HS041_35145 [Planomonospora sp. ID67723]|uniref:hypothetical protein n=1 Tax=Planomonospora sp. ID67723 TaxID=2738134 RepID=UPI0018C3EF44|nr:hypothetical protein [Planomonospora sp. ID67723]MBG0832940.1 hypothetical protein [Planomonospora sp. ID67723]